MYKNISKGSSPPPSPFSPTHHHHHLHRDLHSGTNAKRDLAGQISQTPPGRAWGPGPSDGMAETLKERLLDFGAFPQAQASPSL